MMLLLLKLWGLGGPCGPPVKVLLCFGEHLGLILEREDELLGVFEGLCLSCEFASCLF